MPDLERRSRASFISSKEGGTPDSFSRSLMNRRSSYCLRVSISPNPQVAVLKFDSVVKFDVSLSSMCRSLPRLEEVKDQESIDSQDSHKTPKTPINRHQV